MAKWIEGINVPAMERFVSDLRSGQFNQATGVLKSSSGHCCLGVMMEGLAGVESLDIVANAYNFYAGDRVYSGMPPMSVLVYLGIPDTYLKATGLDDEANVKLVRHEGETIQPDCTEEWIWATSLNDGEGKTFSEIADRFEETFQVKES